MSVPSNNNFGSDTAEERLSRLQSIQSNIGHLHSWFSTLPTDIDTWIVDCYNVYLGLTESARAESLGAQAATLALREKRLALRKELLFAKQYIRSFFEEEDKRRKAFGIDSELPLKADELRAVASTVLQLQEAMASANTQPRLPDALATRLRTAYDGLISTHEEYLLENAEKRQALASEQNRFSDDTRMLRKLLALWHAAMGDEDERIAFIGMVNPQVGNNSAQPGAPSIVLDPHDLALVITPDANRPAPTRYQTQFREVGSDEDWKEFANGSDNRVPTAVALLNAGTDYEFRTRARNANGYGEWSAVIVRMG